MTSLARSSSQRLSTFFISSNNTRFRTRTRRPHAYYVQGQRGVFSTFFSNFMGSNDDGGVENSTQSSRNSSTVTGMTSKGDIIALIAEEHNITNAQSSRIVNGVFDTIMEECANDKKVSISGFGYFQAVPRKARKGRNPSTGEEIMIPETTRVKFAAYKSFKETVSK